MVWTPEDVIRMARNDRMATAAGDLATAVARFYSTLKTARVPYWLRGMLTLVYLNGLFALSMGAQQMGCEEPDAD